MRLFPLGIPREILVLWDVRISERLFIWIVGENLTKQKTNKLLKRNIEFVGPICESADKFSNQKSFSQIKEGDYVGLANSGAYGMSLSSNYNASPTVAEIMVSGSKHKVI